MLEARLQDTINVIAANPLYALLRLGRQNGLNINVDVFSFNSIKDNAAKVTESIANTYSIKNFYHDNSVSRVVNKSKKYTPKDVEIIDRIAEKIINSNDCSPELSIIKSIEALVLQKLSDSKRYLPTRIPLDSFGNMTVV